MKWIKIGLGVVLVPVALVVAIGALLPVDHVATSSATFDQPAIAVWEAITTVRDFPVWRTGVDRVDVTPPGGGNGTGLVGLRWTEIGPQGTLPFVVEVAEPPRRLVARIDSDELPFGGAWTYEVAALPDGTSELTLTENGEVYNPLFRFVSRFVMGHTATMDTYLTSLAAHFAGPGT